MRRTIESEEQPQFISSMVGKGRRNHFAPKRLGMTYGLFNSAEEARYANRDALAHYYPGMFSIERRNANTNTVFVELTHGEKYHPWGVAELEYTHGVNDGTHGSQFDGSKIEQETVFHGLHRLTPPGLITKGPKAT